jgi:hypothetical protein
VAVVATTEQQLLAVLVRTAAGPVVVAVVAVHPTMDLILVLEVTAPTASP